MTQISIFFFDTFTRATVQTFRMRKKKSKQLLKCKLSEKEVHKSAA